jgi:hypothetical protein
MQCVNPKCRQDAQELRAGTLRLLELAIPPEQRIVRADSGFPIVVVPSRYFWLCSQCSRVWKMKRWTPAGLLLEPLPLDSSQEQVLQTVKVAPARQVSQSRFQAGSQRVA